MPNEGTLRDLRDWLEARSARLSLSARAGWVHCVVTGAGVDVAGGAASIEEAVKLACLLYDGEQARRELARERAEPRAGIPNVYVPELEEPKRT
jgi:hypothetical protein